MRTIRRDVDRLRDLGYMIDASAGPGGGYRLGAGTETPPLLLDDDEAVAVAVALGAAAAASTDDVALRVLAKLDQLLPRRLRRRLAALPAVTVSIANPRSAISLSVLAAMAAACRDQVQAAIFVSRQPRRRDRAHRRADAAGAHGLSMVPGRVGPGAERLAHLSRRSRPAAAAARRGRALRATAASRGLRDDGRAIDFDVSAPIPGARASQRHSSQTFAPEFRSGSGSSSRSMMITASSRPAAKPSKWPPHWSCMPASISRCSSRRSWRSQFVTLPPGCCAGCQPPIDTD